MNVSRQKLFLALLAGLVLVGSTLAAGSGSSRRRQKVRKAKAGKSWIGAKKKGKLDLPAVQGKAPNFQLLDHAGKVVKLSDHDGEIIVLEWTNPDCPYVKRHYGAGTMKTLAEKWGEKGVVWLTVNSTHYMDRESNKEFVEQYDLPQRVLSDPSGRVGKLYGARTTPHMVIKAADGTIAYNGAIDDDRHGEKDEPLNYVDAALASLTAGEPVARPRTKPYGCSVKYAR